VYLDFRDAIKARGQREIAARYGNLFELYEQITGVSPWEEPMMIYPAPHYAMGGLWVDYELETNIPGLFAIGEANFSDHGANRLGASAMMQCLADGYFILPQTVAHYLARLKEPRLEASHAAFAQGKREVEDRLSRLLSINGKTPPSRFHRELGHVMLDACGMARSAEGLNRALDEIPRIREEFWRDVKVGGDGQSLNQSLEYAGRVADFLELGELMCLDALERDESCGCHLREEHQTEEGEAVRDDRRYAHVAVWEWAGEGAEPIRHKEELDFEYITPKARSYQ
jgi:succinate dehydrogenase / fumarate reductase flavoprotein subunit